MSWSFLDAINPFVHSSSAPTPHVHSSSAPTPEQMRKEQIRAQRLKAIRLAQQLHDADPSLTCEELKGQWSILTSRDIHFGIPGLKCEDDV